VLGEGVVFLVVDLAVLAEQREDVLGGAELDADVLGGRADGPLLRVDEVEQLEPLLSGRRGTS
jgi:hypothetical protein